MTSPRLTQRVVTRVAGQIDLEAKNHCRATSWYYQGQRCSSPVCSGASSPAVQQHRDCPPPSPPRISTVRCISPASSTAAPPAAQKARPPRRSSARSAKAPSAAPKSRPIQLLRGSFRSPPCRRHRHRPGPSPSLLPSPSPPGQSPRTAAQAAKAKAASRRRRARGSRPAPTGARWGRRVL